MAGEDNLYIECQDLFQIYKRAELEVVALRGLDLEVRRGEFLAIVGSSGSGKTTLLNVLAGLDRPSAGRARVGDRDLLSMSERERATYRQREVGFLWQATSRNLVSYLGARDNIELPMAITGVPRAQRRERAMELLATLGLGDKGDRFLHQLSGGEQQRVGIGVALANRPPLLLADEPTGELDNLTAAEVFQGMRTMCHTYGVTAVVVSHDPTVGRFADRVMQILDGRIAAETVMKATFQHPGEIAQEEYLVVDQMGRLQLPQESVRKLGLTRRARIEVQPDGILIKPPEGRE